MTKLSDYEGAAQLARAISNPKKIVIMSLLQEGKDNSVIMDACEMEGEYRRQALQQYLNTLRVGEGMLSRSGGKHNLTDKGRAALKAAVSLQDIYKEYEKHQREKMGRIMEATKGGFSGKTLDEIRALLQEFE